MAHGLEALRVNIANARIRSEDGRSFIPWQRLSDLCSKKQIDGVLRPFCPEHLRRREAVSLITAGGFRVFAILTLLGGLQFLDRFIDTNSDHALLDSRLPFDNTTLSELLEGELLVGGLVEAFCTQQWEVLTPVFKPNMTHRTFPDMQIMPFLHGSTKSVGEGAFGEVEQVEVPSSHLRTESVPTCHKVLVRKRIRNSDFDEGEPTANSADQYKTVVAFRNESRILSLLRLIRHQCIIELYASYTHRGRHYLLFPRAECHLGQAFKQGYFLDRSVSEVTRMLIGLCSALKHVHEYFSRDLDVKMIGCHHDLKPGNILLLEGRLLLADFGLSKLEEHESSVSPYREASFNYRAPECETVVLSDDTMTAVRGESSWASDVWAWGAIISEVITCRIKGSSGVKEYQDMRKKLLHDTILCAQFHHAGKTCLGTHQWITKLEQAAPTEERALIKLTTDCLRLSPHQRPRARDILVAMYHVYHRSISRDIVTGLHEISARYPILDVKVEKEKFDLWCDATAINGDDAIPQWYAEMGEDILATVSTKLVSMNSETIRFREALSSLMLVPMIRPVQDAVQDLWEFLPHHVEWEMKQRLTVRFITTQDQSMKYATRHSDPLSSLHHLDVNIAAAMRYVAAHLEMAPQVHRNTDRFQLEGNVFKDRVDLGLHRKAVMFSGTSQSQIKQRVILEQVEYNSSWAEQNHGNELIQRVSTLAEFLSDPPDMTRLNLLKCVGFQHNAADRTLILAFQQLTDFPITLRSMIRSTIEDRRMRPSLGSIFKFGNVLAESMLQFHLVGWLHKNLCADNFMLFPVSEDARDVVVAFDVPYLIGFNHSRQSENEAFSHGPTNIDRLRQYVHPEYLTSSPNVRFTHRHEYYSLGIVLLELGLWNCTDAWTRSEKWRKLKLSPQAQSHKILTELVPKLSNTMGNSYMEVVKHCMTWAEDGERATLEALTTKFRQIVLEPLSKAAFYL